MHGGDCEEMICLKRDMFLLCLKMFVLQMGWENCFCSQWFPNRGEFDEHISTTNIWELWCPTMMSNTNLLPLIVEPIKVYRK
jgi:hypothetical protein